MNEKDLASTFASHIKDKNYMGKFELTNHAKNRIKQRFNIDTVNARSWAMGILKNGSALNYEKAFSPKHGLAYRVTDGQATFVLDIVQSKVITAYPNTVIADTLDGLNSTDKDIILKAYEKVFRNQVKANLEKLIKTSQTLADGYTKMNNDRVTFDLFNEYTKAKTALYTINNLQPETDKIISLLKQLSPEKYGTMD